MGLETLIYEKGDRLATMTLKRPERSNALCRLMRDDMDLVMDDLDRGLPVGSGEPSRPEDSRPHRRAPRTFFTDERAGFVSGQVLYFAGGPHG